MRTRMTFDPFCLYLRLSPSWTNQNGGSSFRTDALESKQSMPCAVIAEPFRRLGPPEVSRPCPFTTSVRREGTSPCQHTQNAHLLSNTLCFRKCSLQTLCKYTSVSSLCQIWPDGVLAGLFRFLSAISLKAQLSEVEECAHL